MCASCRGTSHPPVGTPARHTRPKRLRCHPRPRELRATEAELPCLLRGAHTLRDPRSASRPAEPGLVAERIPDRRGACPAIHGARHSPFLEPSALALRIQLPASASPPACQRHCSAQQTGLSRSAVYSTLEPSPSPNPAPAVPWLASVQRVNYTQAGCGHPAVDPKPLTPPRHPRPRRPWPPAGAGAAGRPGTSGRWAPGATRMSRCPRTGARSMTGRCCSRSSARARAVSGGWPSWASLIVALPNTLLVNMA